MKDAQYHTSSENWTLKQQWGDTKQLSESPKSRTLATGMLSRLWNSRLSCIAGGMPNHTATVEEFGNFLQKQTYSYHTTQQSHSLVFIQWIENICQQKNLHVTVYSSFIPNCPNLKVTKMPSVVKGWTHCGTARQWILVSIKKKWWASSQEKTLRNLRCTVLSEGSQSERLHTAWFQPYYMLKTAKPLETIKRSVAA